MLMSQDNPKATGIELPNIYIFSYFVKIYMSFNYGIIQRIRFSHCEPITKNCDNKFQIKHLRTNVDLLLTAK